MDNRLTGKILGDYEVQEMIGKGGMGEVYLGRQISLDRNVAIKVLLQEYCADHEYVERFLREARAAANLNHANVTQIFDAGVTDGIYFFVMEYVDGNNIGQILREQGPQPEMEALYVIQQSAEGLAFAHQKGIVHRDVKPENIMVTGQGAVKIGDLGLAKWKPSEAETGLTSTGSTMGTPFYISPEQIRGQKDIDGRADIYSLGMTFYHMLSGKPPFHQGSAPEIMAQHLSDKIPPLEKFNPKISKPTLELIKAMTEKKREDRIQDMYEVADIIAQQLGFKPVSPRTPDRNFKERERKRERSYLFFFILSLCALIIAYVLWPKSKPTISIIHSLTEPETAAPTSQEPPEKAPAIPQPKESFSEKVSSEKAPSPVSEIKTEEKKPSPSSEPRPKPAPRKEPTEKAERPPVRKPEKEKPPPPEPIRITPIIIDGIKSIRSTTLLNGILPLNDDLLTIAISDNNLKGSEFPFETKVLVGVDLFRDQETFSKLINNKLSDVVSATLELTVYPGTRAGLLSREARLGIQAHRVLKKWGIDSNFFDFKNNKNKDDETNWKMASEREAIKWSKPGIGQVGSDFTSNPLPVANDRRNGTTAIISTRAPPDKVIFDILPDLSEIAEIAKKDQQVPAHYGWVLSVSQGYGKVLFYSEKSDQGPKVILEVKSSMSDSKEHPNANP